jgi:thiaminase/transcriptional activator TenA
LLRTAQQADLGEIVAAMVPCMRLYTFLGIELAAFRDSDHPYAHWIETYSSDEFRGLCERLESLLDEVAADSPRIREAYRHALKCELDFFSAPLENT